jgi:hypothetical protein
MIEDNNIIQLKGASKKDKVLVKEILLNSYKELVNEIEKEADYCDVIGYWKDNIPTSKPIITAKEFINIYKNLLDK